MVHCLSVLRSFIIGAHEQDLFQRYMPYGTVKRVKGLKLNRKPIMVSEETFGQPAFVDPPFDVFTGETIGLFFLEILD